MYKFSYFPNILNVKGSTTIEINKFFELIKSGLIHKDTIEKIRNTTINKEQKNNLKKILPAITTSGIFENGRSEKHLISHSGLICIDIDNLNELNFKEVRNQLEKDFYSFAIFTSPSGTGLKVFIKIENNQKTHLESFLQLEKYFFDTYKIVIDKACKDVTRLCFISYDKNIFINENSLLFEIPKPKEIFVNTQIKEKQTSKNINVTTASKETFVNNDKENEVLNLIEIIKSQQIDITKNYAHWLKICFSLVDFFGERGRGYFHDISKIYTGYNEQQTDEQFNKCLKTNTGKIKINTLFYFAKENGINIAPTKKTSSMQPPAQAIAQETQTTAQEQNKQTWQEKELKNNYVRIGISYFKKITITDKYGIDNHNLERWSKQTIIDDFASKEISYPHNLVPKYDSFINMPNNLDYKQVYSNCYNLYQELTHKIKKGTFEKTTEFLKHIFQNKYEIGLDYITLLYQQPTQMLPILCFVSEERKTGKSTFLKYLRNLFQSNCTILSNENFASNFNGHFASKLIIGIDETFISAEKQEQSERIKKMATDEKTILMLKGVDGKEIDFYGKLIMCSNNETNFVSIDKLENRYFINKVPPLTKENPNLLDEMVKEIPAFIEFLSTRKTTYQKETRHFFDDSLLQTEALNRIKNGNHTNKEKEIISTIIECFERSGEKELNYTPAILHQFIQVGNKTIQKIDIGNFLKIKMNLKPEISTRYNYFDLLKAQNDENYKGKSSTVGSYFKLNLDMFTNLG